MTAAVHAPARHRDDLWIALVLAALAAGLALSQWTWRIDRVVYDRALSLWSRPAPPQITVIAIDDASVAAIGRWPWPRAVHATLLEQLAAARPKAVALDLVLSEPDPVPEQDRLLAQAMRHAAPVVLPVPWLVLNGRSPQWLEPVPLLAQAAVLAVAEPAVDADGVLRHLFLKTGDPGAMRSHVAQALLEAAGESLHPAIRPQFTAADADAGAAEAGWRRDGRLLIRYSGPPGHVERLSYVDVLRGVVPRERLAGRYLLVGMTAQGLGDTLATPVNAHHQAMPGVEVLAQSLHMLRSGDGLQAVPPAALAAASAALVFAGVLGMARLGQRAALAAAMGMAIAVLAISTAAVAWGWWFAPTPLVLAALLAYPLWSWRRLESAVAGLDAEIRRLDSEHLGVQMPVDSSDPIDARLARLQSAGTLMRDARRFLADVLASLPTAMLVADAAGRVLMANAQAAALFEIDSAGELQGLDLARLLAEFSTPDATDWAATLADLVAGGERPVVQARLAEQGDFVVQLAAAELAGSRRVLVAISDVAPVKRAERQREEALAFVSHDLRSPASTLLLLADAALAKGARRGGDELMPQVRRLAQRMLEMSEAFVRYAQADLVAPRRDEVTLALLLDEATAELGPQTQAAGVRLEVGHAPVGAVARIDRGLVSRAIANLVANAVRHSPAGGTVSLWASTESGRLTVRVADQGPGLDAEQQRRLLRGDEGLGSDHAGGVGLGLRFVQRVARVHRGQLRWLPAGDGQPACFELELEASGEA